TLSLLLVPVTLCLTRVDSKAQGQRNEAEKHFREMEKKVSAAKAVRVVGDLVLKAPGKEAKVQLSLTFAPGNKARLKMKGDLNGKEVGVEAISDGKEFRTIENPPGKKGTPLHMTEQQNDYYRVALTRLGLAGLVELPPL